MSNCECKFYKEFNDVLPSNEATTQQRDVKIITYPYCKNEPYASKHGLSKKYVYGVVGGNTKLRCGNDFMKCDIDKLENNE